MDVARRAPFRRVKTVVRIQADLDGYYGLTLPDRLGRYRAVVREDAKCSGALSPLRSHVH